MIVFRCPTCKIRNEAPLEHGGKETYCLKCLRLYTIPTESQDLTNGALSHSAPDNLFEQYSQHYGPDVRWPYEFHVFI